jgi:hypothetical protein
VSVYKRLGGWKALKTDTDSKQKITSSRMWRVETWIAKRLQSHSQLLHIRSRYTRAKKNVLTRHLDVGSRSLASSDSFYHRTPQRAGGVPHMTSSLKVLKYSLHCNQVRWINGAWDWGKPGRQPEVQRELSTPAWHTEVSKQVWG